MKGINSSEIIQSIREGKHSSLEDLYGKHRNEYIQWISRQFTQLDDDLLIESWQEAVIEFYDQIRRGKLVQLSCEVKTYLFVLAKRYLIKIYKSGHYAQHAELDEIQLQHLSSIPVEDEQDIEQEQRMLLLQAMDQMGKQCIELLHYKFTDELSLEEIKNKKSYASLNAVSASLSRCLRKLRDLVKQRMNQRT